jgi:hypothetical protein
MLGGVMIDGTKLLSDKPAEWGELAQRPSAPAAASAAGPASARAANYDPGR